MITLKDIFHSMDDHSLSMIRIMMLEIRDRIDEPVEINESTVKSLYINLLTENYDTIMMYHGECFTTAIMKLYAECELYEKCAKIKADIKSVNNLIEKHEDDQERG
jgi:hypothetical protein